MKPIITFAISLIFFHLASGQTVKPANLRQYEGTVVTVCSKVVETLVTPSNTTILYFDKTAPNHTFEVHIWGKDLSKFSYVPADFLKGKNVCVTGQVKMFKEKPDFIIKSEEALKVQ